jgi:DNA-binding transcriptional LysR family regulator
MLSDSMLSRHHGAMELRQLRYFLAVADELHVGRAAARLHLGQPTLSRQIVALEKAIGVPLFTRVRRRFALTPAGEFVRDGAQEIIRRSDSLVRDAQRAHRGELGTLRIGFVQSATFQALPRLVGAFRVANPDAELDARAMTTLEQITALCDGQIDAGLLRPPVNEPALATRVISTDPLVAALPARHRLARRRSIPLAALADESFILYKRVEGPTVQDRIIGYCMSAGFTPRIVQEAIDVQTMVALVAAGLGVSLLIAPTPPTDGAVVYVPLAEDLPLWEMAIAWSSDNRSPVLARFLNAAKGAAT